MAVPEEKGGSSSAVADVTLENYVRRYNSKAACMYRVELTAFIRNLGTLLIYVAASAFAVSAVCWFANVCVCAFRLLAEKGPSSLPRVCVCSRIWLSFLLLSVSRKCVVRTCVCLCAL